MQGTFISELDGTKPFSNLSDVAVAFARHLLKWGCSPTLRISRYTNRELEELPLAITENLSI